MDIDSHPVSRVGAEEGEVMKKWDLKVVVKESTRHHLSLGHVGEEILVVRDILG